MRPLFSEHDSRVRYVCTTGDCKIKEVFKKIKFSALFNTSVFGQYICGMSGDINNLTSNIETSILYFCIFIAPPFKELKM